MQNQAGFTLVELIGAIVILIILSLLAMPTFSKAFETTRTGISQTSMTRIVTALETYKAHHGYYPSRLSALQDDSLISQSVTFETPWSGKKKLYFFYAVDSGGETAQAYALADPGPRCSTQAVLSQATQSAIPCGKTPTVPAWIWSGDKPTLSLENEKGETVKRTTLGGFRPDVRTES